MTQERTLTRGRLKTPKAAALAGIVFSVLLIMIIWLLRTAVPADPRESGAWLSTKSSTVALALDLVPVAGVAFLWFIGVLRDRLGQNEDRFFATVFFGSGLLFLAMLFVWAAVVGAIIQAFASHPEELINSLPFHFGRALAFNLVSQGMVKISAVFIVSTSTLEIYTRIAPRWIAVLGYILALILLFGGGYVDSVLVAFPLWVLLLSVYILFDNLRR